MVIVMALTALWFLWPVAWWAAIELAAWRGRARRRRVSK